MQIKRYTVAALILIVLVGWYVYSFITQDTLAINFFGIELPLLSIAIWVIAPLVILYIVSVIHMFFYSFMNNLKFRKYEKDFEKIVDAMVDAYLGKENRVYSYKTDRYKLLGSLVDNSTIFPFGKFDVNIENKKISDVIGIINSIRNGNVVDLKKYALSSSNELVIQNERNRYKKSEINAEDILSSSNKYDIKLCREVYIDFVKKAPLKSIEKYKNALTKDALFVILSRVNADEDTLVISNESLISLFKDLDLNLNDYIEASKRLSKTMLPEQRIKLFETLSNENEMITEAYLFTLFDLEMIDPAKEILDNSQEGDYIRFKIYSSLKDCGKCFDINLFI